MTTYAIGEVAIYIGLTGENVNFNGEECIITLPLAERMHRDSLEWGYGVSDRAGYFFVSPINLRKKHPPASTNETARLAMLDCIERARRGCEVSA